MKCPKCGFVGFDHLDSCKKCGTDLADHKAKFGIRSLFVPSSQSSTVVPETDSAADKEEGTSGEEGSDFGFDFLNDDDASMDGGAESPDPVAATEVDDGYIGFAADDGVENDEFSATPDDTRKDEESADEGAGFGFSAGEAADDFDFEEMEPPRDEDPVDDLGEDDLIEEWEEDLGEEPLLDDDPEKGKDQNSPFESRGMDMGSPSPGTNQIALSPAEPHDEEVQADLFPAAAPGLAGEHVASEDFVASGRTETSPSQPLISFAAEDLGIENDEPLLNEPAIASQEKTDRDGSAEPGESPVQAPASFLLKARLAAALFDLIVVSLVVFLFVCSAEFMLNPEGNGLSWPRASTLTMHAIPYFLVLFCIGFAYFTLFHYLSGQTPGKMWQRLRIESVSGAPLLFSQAFLHSVGGLVCLIPCAAGFVSVLLSPSGRGWNDRFAGSRVVGVLDERQRLGPATGTDTQAC